jgi:tRNA pseudouridine13 synthase
MGKIESNIIEKEKIRNEDFIVPGLPHCSSKGSRREIVCPVNDISYDIEENGYKVRFSLSKGNYATSLIREYMNSEMISY